MKNKLLLMFVRIFSINYVVYWCSITLSLQPVSLEMIFIIYFIKLNRWGYNCKIISINNSLVS